MIKKLFILSTKAGNGDFDSLREKILKTYESHNRLDELEIVSTKDRDHCKRAALEFSKMDYPKKVVIACGGDGTLGEISGVLAGTDTSLGLIPMGTGNDFSKNFNYKDFKIEDTFEPEIRPIDLIKINDRTCINVTSIGFDTHILNTTYKILESYPKLGRRAFPLAIIRSLLNIKNEKIFCQVEDKDGEILNLKGEFIISALCNGGYYGSGFNPSPSAKIDDGILNLVLVDKLSTFQLFPLIFKYKKGTHVTNKKVREYKVVSGKIKSEDGALANIDGDIFEFKEIDFKIIPKGINWAYF